MFQRLGLAVLPGLLFLAYLLHLHDGEPGELIVQLYWTAGAAVFPVAAAERRLVRELQYRNLNEHHLGYNILTSGLPEELGKLLVVVTLAYRHPAWNGTYDGVIYAAAVSLGFATVENVFFVLRDGMGWGLIRGLFSVPNHGVWGLLMGFCLSMARLSDQGSHRAFFTMLALWLPAFLHGLSNHLLFRLQQRTAWLWAFVSASIALWVSILTLVLPPILGS